MLVLSALLCNLGNSVGQYYPTVARTLAGSRDAALLISLPPFLLAAIVGWLSARASDRSGRQCVERRAALADAAVSLMPSVSRVWPSSLSS